MFPTKLLLGILVRALLCLLVSAACYFMFIVVVGGEPWVAEADVLKVSGAKALSHLNWQKMPADEYGEISEAKLKGFSGKGIEKLFARNMDGLSLRFRKWLIGAVFFPFRRARERGLPLPRA